MNAKTSVGKTIKEIYPDIEPHWIERYGRIAITQEPIHFEDYNHNTKKWYDAIAFSPSVGKFAMLFRDITDRKKAEEALKKSEKKYKQLFDNMASGFALQEIITDKDGNPIDYIFLEVNEAFESLTTLKGKDIIGKKATEALPGIEDDPADWISKYGRVALTGESLKFEQFSRRFDRWYSIIAYSPEKRKFAITFDDITERKKAEEALKETNKSLEEMVYITSHDLQSPLVSMEGFASVVLNNNRDKLDEQGIHQLERIKSNTQRMHHLVLSLLDISRLSTKKNPFITFNAGKIIKDVLIDLSLMIEKEGIKVETGEIPKIIGDKLRIRGVFRKLITNAVIYGGKNIEIGFKDKAFFVKDDGIGIDNDQLENIFKPGERLKDIKTEGVGMGLTFCRKVIIQHNGKLWAESDGEGKGSTFYFKVKTKR